MDILLVDIFKITLSAILGLLVGYERDKHGKPAGLRDISLVTAGATIFAIIGLKLIDIPGADITRLFHASILGIGFLGSGVIIQNKNHLEGITTACVLFVAVGLGLFCGLGDYILAIFSAIMIYAILQLKWLKEIIYNKINQKRGKNGKKKI